MGRVINLDNNKSKLFIIEKEFHNAEKHERNKQRDEEEARRQVRARRMSAIEASRKLALVHQVKENCRIQRDIVATTREAKGLTIYKQKQSRFKMYVAKIGLEGKQLYYSS